MHYNFVIGTYMLSCLSAVLGISIKWILHTTIEKIVFVGRPIIDQKVCIVIIL